jgi:hypothetical protein
MKGEDWIAIYECVNFSSIVWLYGTMDMAVKLL